MNDEQIDRAGKFFGSADEQGDLIPERLGRYEIIREIARGGMGVVYEAEDPDLGRRVALKILKREDAEQLRREATVAAKFSHPNVVTIYDVGPTFLAMELIEGRRLDEVAPEMSLPARLAILEIVARAVGSAHARGLIHRDLKPENVLIEAGGRVVLTDFGLARLVQKENLARSIALAGTPSYTAPEQIEGRADAIGPPTDVWALGVMLHEMVAGAKPFEGESVAAVHHLIVNEPPRPLAGELGAVAEKALGKDPRDRYATATELADELRRYLAGEGVLARPSNMPQRLWRRVRRAPGAHALGAAVVLVSVAAAIFWQAGRLERRQLLASVREQARVSLDAALYLRRAGALDDMKQFLAPLRSAYDKALERSPREPELDYLMGRMYRALLNDDRALEHQSRALDKDPSYAPALYERGVLLALRYGRGLKAAYAARSADGDVVENSRDLENGNRELGAMRSAYSADLRRYLARVTDRGVARDRVAMDVARGILSYEADALDEAREALVRATKADPAPVETWELMTLVDWAQGMREPLKAERRWAAQEKLLDQRIAADVGYLPLLIERISFRHRRARQRRRRGLDALPGFRAAVEDCDRVIAMDPNNVAAWSWKTETVIFMGVYLWETGGDPRPHYQQAQALAEREIALAPQADRGWHNRGLVRFYRSLYLMELDQDAVPEFEAADLDFSQALKRNTSKQSSQWRARSGAHHGTALARRGQDPTAVFEKSDRNFALAGRNTSRVDFWQWVHWGTLYLEWGRYHASVGRDPRPKFEQAEALLTKGIGLAPANPDAWRLRGMVRRSRAEFLDKERDLRGAWESYLAASSDLGRALAMNPNFQHWLGDLIEPTQRAAAILKAKLQRAGITAPGSQPP